jgi:hypothetical protein
MPLSPHIDIALSLEVNVIASIRYRFSVIIYLLSNFSNSLDFRKQDIQIFVLFQVLQTASTVIGA